MRCPGCWRGRAPDALAERGAVDGDCLVFHLAGRFGLSVLQPLEASGARLVALIVIYEVATLGSMVAIVLTARVLGWKLGLARAVGAVLFAFVVGLLMALFFINAVSLVLLLFIPGVVLLLGRWGDPI